MAGSERLWPKPNGLLYVETARSYISLAAIQAKVAAINAGSFFRTMAVLFSVEPEPFLQRVNCGSSKTISTHAALITPLLLTVYIREADSLPANAISQLHSEI
jgi:hypothetical protein